MQQGKADMFRYMYHETSGGLLTAEDTQECLFAALYALRMDAGVISGMRTGQEEYALEWGPLDNNGKGQRRALREFILGHSNRSTDRGYVSIISPTILKSPLNTSGPSEDLANWPLREKRSWTTSAAPTAPCAAPHCAPCRVAASCPPTGSTRRARTSSAPS
jgi:hypothetical protein